MAMNANLRRMTNGDKAVAAGLLVMLIAAFLPWISVSTPVIPLPGGGSVGGMTYSSNGYASWGWLYWLFTYLMIAFWVVRVLIPDMVQVPPLPVKDAMLFMGGAVVAVVGALLYQNAGGFNSIGWGWFVALAGAVIVLVGGFLKQQDPAPALHPSQSAGGYGGPPYTGGSEQQPRAYPPAAQAPAPQQAPPYVPPRPSAPPQSPPPQSPPPQSPPPQGPPAGGAPPPPPA